MRGHWIHCFEQKEFSLFPATRRKPYQRVEFLTKLQEMCKPKDETERNSFIITFITVFICCSFITNTHNELLLMCGLAIAIPKNP